MRSDTKGLKFIWSNAIWFAVVTGLLEGLILFCRWRVLDQSIGLSVDAYWMAPIANVLLFSVPGLFLSFVKKFSQRLVSQRIILFVFGMLGCLSLLFVFPLAKHSILILAAGLALAGARFLDSRSEGFLHLQTRSLPYLVFMVGIIIVIVSVVET